MNHPPDRRDDPNVIAASLASGDHAITVQFLWTGDRFTHRVLFGEHSTLADSGILASCVDGDASAEWPASPPLQQISEEVINDTPVILGVGSAGRSHWSVSVVSVDSAEGHGLKFEWACRHKLPPQFLGTTYQFRSPLRIHVDEQTTCQRREAETTILVPNQSSEQGTQCWSYTLMAGPASG